MIVQEPQFPDQGYKGWLPEYHPIANWLQKSEGKE